MSDEENKDKLRSRLMTRRRTPPVAAETVAEESSVGTDIDANITPAPAARQGRDRTAESVAGAMEGSNFIITLARHLGAGNTLSVHVDPKNDKIVKVELYKGTGAPTPKRGSLGSDYYLHIHNPAYWGWESKWKALSQEEKVEYADKLGVVWDKHENPKINNMRITEAVRLFEKVEKYKPEYSTVTQRKNAKERYLGGMLDMSGDHE